MVQGRAGGRHSRRHVAIVVRLGQEVRTLGGRLLKTHGNTLRYRNPSVGHESYRDHLSALRQFHLVKCDRAS